MLVHIERSNVLSGVNLKGGVLWCVLWIWDYFHDKGLLFQGQGLIAHKGVIFHNSQHYSN